MADFKLNPVVLRPGSVDIKEIVIVSGDGVEVDILPLMLELNIFEDIFSSTLSGNILISDGQNLISTLPIIGDEYIRVQFVTPTFPDNDKIYRTFRVYSLTDRAIVQDDRNQQYLLHFCSPEAFLDNLQKVSQTYKGTADTIVPDIFLKYLNMARNVFGINKQNTNPKDSDSNTPLYIMDAASNHITFTSPSWSPLKCINWLLSKSIPKNNKGASLLFFETNKQFVVASPEQLIQAQLDSNMIFEDYIHTPAGVKEGDRRNDVLYKKPSLDRNYRIVESFTVDTTFNTLDNTRAGYYASKLYQFNVDTKEIAIFDFDYINRYNDFSHLETIEGKTGGPMFTKQTFRNPDSLKLFYPKNPGLYSDTPTNLSDVVQSTMQNRISLLNELSSYRIHAVVNGRTDIEVGMVTYFEFPNIMPKDATIPINEGNEDPILGGYYLITAVRHKITTQSHKMVLELVKDSSKRDLG